MLNPLTVAVLLAAVLGAPAEIVRLRDGTLVHGTIVDFDEGAGFVLERADNGGRLRLRWDHLPAEEVRRIKAARGFTGEQIEPYFVDVVHLVMKNGTTETGALVADGRRDVYVLRRRSGVDEFPRRYVQSVESGRVEGLQIHAPEELYLRILDEQGAPTTAAGHFEVAVACEGARLYARAQEHYRSAGDLDRAFKPDLIAARLARVGVKVEEAAATEVLDEVRQRLFRRQFDQAQELLATFRATHPASRQLGEAADLERQVSDRRREAQAGRIVSDYFSFLGASLSRIARTDGMTLGGAMELVEDGVHGEIVDKLARGYGSSPETIQALWDERRGGSLRTSGYGTGTFILGADRALKWKLGRLGAEDEDAAAAEEAGGDDLDARIEEVLARRREEAAARRAAAQRNRGLESVGLTPDEWWDSVGTEERERWLTAYFAEASGQTEVVRAKPVDCRTCRASGAIEVLNEREEVERVTCPTCKGLRYERLVSFR